MHKVALGAVALALSLLRCACGLRANESDQRRHQEWRRRIEGHGGQRLWLRRQQYFPVVEVDRSAEGHQELRHQSVYDPDAPTGSGFWHWVVFNIPASTTSIPKNAGDVKAKLMPEGAIQSRTDYGADGYGGMCPPKGDKPHHYTLTVLRGR